MSNKENESSVDQGEPGNPATLKQYNLISDLLVEIPEIETAAIPASYTHESMTTREASEFIGYLKELKYQRNGNKAPTAFAFSENGFSPVKHGLAVKLAQRQLLAGTQNPMTQRKAFGKAIKFYYAAMTASEAEIRLNGGGLK